MSDHEHKFWDLVSQYDCWLSDASVTFAKEDLRFIRSEIRRIRREVRQLREEHPELREILPKHI